MVEASVLLASYNNGPALLRCLERLGRQSVALDSFEVVVVIDGSTDGTRQALERTATPFALRFVEQPNAGRAAALNRAAAEARGRLLIVTDPDVLPGARFVESHLAAHDRADVVIGPIALSDASPASFLTDGVQHWAERHDREMRRREGEFHCSEIYGANLSIRKDRFDALGGYRTDLLRTEDFQLGKKILVAGYSVAYCPEAAVQQVYDKTFPEWCADQYRDGLSHAKFAGEFPEEIPHLKLGRYFPETPVKRFLRPRVIDATPLGSLILLVSRAALETARGLGLRWRSLAAWKGVIGDALFWQGVRDELGRERFRALIHRGAPSPTAERSGPSA